MPADSRGGALRILMISPAGVGGTTQYAHNLCNALADAGHEVVLATALDCEMAGFSRSYELLGVFDRFRPHAGPLRAFIARVRALNPDVIHLQGAQRPEFYWLLLKILSAITDARFVWTPQDIVSNSRRGYHARLLRKTYARMAHVFLNARQNETALRALYDVPPERISVLPIPDLVAFARTAPERAWPPEIDAVGGADPAAPLILCFGLIEPRKGISELIRAFARLAPGRAGRLVIMGKPLTDMAPFEAEVARTGLPPDRLQIVPRYASFPEMAALFEAAALVVLPYVQGWNSGVLASAYGFGRPVVATRVGGFDEVVQDEHSGLLVPPGDEAALAAAMARVLDDPALAATLRDGARAAGQAASWQAVAAQTETTYREILAAQVAA